MSIFKKLRWYMKLLYVFARLSILKQVEYRLNFISGFVVESAYMLIKLIYLVVVLEASAVIGGLTPDMIMIFTGTYMFMTGIWMLLQGTYRLPRQVLTGELDLLMVKPGSLLFLQTFGSFNFATMLPNVLTGTACIIIGWLRSGIPGTFQNIGGFLFYMLCAIVMTYAFVLLPALLIFWVTSVNGVFTLFAALWDFNNMPMTIYTKTIQQIGTFVIPVFLLSNWAGLFVLNKLSPLQMIWGVLVPVALTVLADRIWRRGLKRYSSANG